MYDYFGRSLSDVEESLTQQKRNFKAQKAIILRHCNDWEKSKVEELIGQIEAIKFVQKFDKLPIENAYQLGLICEASKEELIVLLTILSYLRKDERTINKNKRPE